MRIKENIFQAQLRIHDFQTSDSSFLAEIKTLWPVFPLRKFYTEQSVH